jgi:hypothetical protein
VYVSCRALWPVNSDMVRVEFPCEVIRKSSRAYGGEAVAPPVDSTPRRSMCNKTQQGRGSLSIATLIVHGFISLENL